MLIGAFNDNFYLQETLRALYLGDNDFEYLPKEVGNLKNLQIVSLLDLLSTVHSDQLIHFIARTQRQ